MESPPVKSDVLPTVPHSSNSSSFHGFEPTVIYSNPSDMDGSQHFFHNLLLPYHSDHVLQNYQITLFTDIDSVKLPSIVTPV